MSDYSTPSGVMTAPPAHAAAVTPNDDTDLTYETRGLSFATPGALTVTMAGGETTTIPSGALAAGLIHPMRVVRVLDTGTDADGIVAWW